MVRDSGIHRNEHQQIMEAWGGGHILTTMSLSAMDENPELAEVWYSEAERLIRQQDKEYAKR